MVWIYEDLTAMLYLSVENWNFSSLYKSTWFTLARNGITAPLFKAPTPFPDMPSLNFFCFPNLFSIPPFFKAFYIVPPHTTSDSQATILIQHTRFSLHDRIENIYFR